MGNGFIQGNFNFPIKIFFQTEAETRRREAGVIQSIWIEKAGHVYTFICLYVNMYACMSFKDFSRLKALTEPKMVPYGRMVDNTLLRHAFSALVTPGRAWHVIEAPISLTLWSGQLPPQLHVILTQILRCQN